MTPSIRRLLPTSMLSGATALTLVCAFSFGAAQPAEARGGHVSLSVGVGVPFGYYGGYYGRGYYAGWYGAPYPYYYAPYYYGPEPVYYSRPYNPPYYGSVTSLGLFPASVGAALNNDDRGIYYGAYQRALAAPVGETMAWNSGNISGEVTTTRDGWAGQRYCRQFSQSISIGGQAQESIGTACQTPNGAWQLVPNQ